MAINNQDITTRIIGLKRIIEQRKKERDQAEGRKQALMDKLASMGLDTIEVAERKATQLEKEINALSTKLDKGLLELEEKYG